MNPIYTLTRGNKVASGKLLHKNTNAAIALMHNNLHAKNKRKLDCFFRKVHTHTEPTILLLPLGARAQKGSRVYTVIRLEMKKSEGRDAREREREKPRVKRNGLFRADAALKILVRLCSLSFGPANNEFLLMTNYRGLAIYCRYCFSADATAARVARFVSLTGGGKIVGSRCASRME